MALGSFPGYIVGIGNGRGEFTGDFASAEVPDRASPAEAGEGQEGGWGELTARTDSLAIRLGRVDFQTHRHVGGKSRIHQAAGSKQIGIQIQTSGARSILDYQTSSFGS